MAGMNLERVQNALNELLERIVPEYPDEDETVGTQRFEEAHDFAFNELMSAGEPAVVADINHMATLIDAKLAGSADGAYNSGRLQNLLSRYVSQPVLDQKARMLQLLLHLSDLPDTPDMHESPRSAPVASHRPQPSHVSAPASPAFKEAFSRPGLSQIPTGDESPADLPPLTKRIDPVERRRERLRQESSREQSVDAAPVAQPTLPSGPTEPALLRDLPFTLQGLSSSNLAFDSATALKIPSTLPIPIVSLLHALAEPSLLYRGLSEFVESSEGGLVGQSFRAALGKELRSYLSLVATLEGQIRRALAQLDELQPHHGLGKAGVTLKRCVIWTREATMGLRLMSLMVEQSKGKKGGELITLIHSFSSTHGDPYVGAFAERLLPHVTRPFYDMLRQWIYDGELADPYGEFFVLEQSEAEILAAAAASKEDKGGATSVWEDKYKLNEHMVPSIITSEFANKVFLIGKTLNFIRYGCGDSAWVDTYSRTTSKELSYGDTANLSQSIGDAYKTTMARLIDLMANKFHLFEHLQALKKYLLLGAGDFIALLMESLSQNLDRPANTQYRHTLTAQLEHAVRNSNAQFDPPDVLRRLDARMLELSHGEIGWDVFTLEYKIDAPVDVIVTPFGSKQYLKVFNFLWRVKRVEFALGSTWRRCMTGARGVLGEVSDTVGADWKKARCAVAEMIHFVNQLQYYILFEVIESSWNELQDALKKPESTLDDLIKAHGDYLLNITRKGLLGGGQKEDHMGQLHELLKCMLAYKDAVDGLYSFSVAECARRSEQEARIETRTAKGQWGLSEKDAVDSPGALSSSSRRSRSSARPDADSPSPFPGSLLNLPGLKAGRSNVTDDDVLPALRKRLASLTVDFRTRVTNLLGDLLHQPDHDLRWLAMMMNYNDNYQVPRRAPRRKEKRKEEKTPMVPVREESFREKEKETGREPEKDKEKEKEKEREREKYSGKTREEYVREKLQGKLRRVGPGDVVNEKERARGTVSGR